METAKKPKKTAPQAEAPAPACHVYHVYATRKKDGHETAFNGIANTPARILDDAGFHALRQSINAVLDADPEAKATKGAFLTVESLSYLGESSPATR